MADRISVNCLLTNVSISYKIDYRNKEYRSSGGSIGFFGLKKIENRVKNIEKEFKTLSQGKTLKAASGKRILHAWFRYCKIL